MRRSLILLFVIISGLCNAQETDWRLYQSDDTVKVVPTINTSSVQEGEITVISSPSLDTLTAILQKEVPELKGFRVLVYMGISKSKADKNRSVYLKKEYSWPLYLNYKAPNFLVAVGDFMTRLAAEKVKEQLKSDYSNPYIILTGINPPNNRVSMDGDESVQKTD